MKGRIREILTDLERVRENLLALSDDIWLNIDHNDTDALRAGAEFKAGFNARFDALGHAATDLSSLISTYTTVALDEASLPTQGAEAPENQRRIYELDQSVPHSLDEEFVYKRPAGFILKGQAYAGVSTCRRIYELVCRHLAECDRQRFQGLPDNPRFVSNRGNPSFARSPKLLREALQLGPDSYAEVNLSANSIVKEVRKLLAEFGVAEREMTIYLRRDDNAE